MGNIIAISGIDGSGKSTCAAIIKSILNGRGKPAVIIDAMKNGVLAEALKTACKCSEVELRKQYSPKTLNMCWLADLLYNYETKVKESIRDGNTVILHRSELCCRVYSRLFDPDDSTVDSILDRLDISYDKHILLKISPHEAFHRIAARSMGATTEKETFDMLVKANDLYESYLSHQTYSNVCVIGEHKKDKIFDELKKIIDEC